MQKIILLIDDDPDELEVLNRAFDKAGIDSLCIWAGTPEKAFQLFQQYIPDAVFIDLNMPKQNSLNCLSKIKKMDQLKDAPVILYSTSIEKTTRQIAWKMGATWCIQKTNSLQELTENISTVFTATPVLQA